VIAMAPFFLALTILFRPHVQAVAHPLHVSVTEITYDTEERELEIIMRIFADDLELAIRQQTNNPELDLLHPQNTTTTALVGAYVTSHLTLYLDNKEQPTRYLGEEVEGDVIVAYIQVAGVKSWKTISVRNDLIMHLYDDQSNIVHVTVADRVRSLRLTPDEPRGTLTFN
jgi:hypothetical protein